MNDYEISKLKKQLQRKNELLKEERQDREFIEQQLIQIHAERDKYHGQLLIARQTIQNVDQIRMENVREMKAKIQQQNSASLNELQSLRDKLMEEKHFNERLKEENRNKDTVISELSSRLRQLSLKHKDNSYLITTKQITQQAMITHNQFYKLTDKYNKLCEDMENIMAENKILRKLHGVPDNFGFDLEEIKIAEKQQLQDYKAQCRKLEAEIQELQAERTQLRYRLRQYNTLYSNKGQRYKDLTQRQLQYLDAYALNLKEGKVDFPEIDKSQKQMEKQIIKLRAKVQVLENRGHTIMPGRKQSNDQISGDKISQESMRKLQDQIRSTLQPFVQDIRQLSQTNLGSLIQNLQNLQIQGQTVPTAQYIQGGGDFNPPIPLPRAHNDWSKISQGYSYKYSSKIPVDLKEYENDLEFDQLKARYQIAALQLQNIESLKMLKEKQDQQNLLVKQLHDLKEKYSKCLNIQDQLFVQYFAQKENQRENSKKNQILKKSAQNQRDQVRAELEILRNAFNTLSTKTDIQDKYKSFAERLAKSEAGFLKAQHKYEIIQEEQKSLREAYTKLKVQSTQKEFTLKQKLLSARGNQKQMTMLMSQVLEQTRNSVSSDTHNILLSKMEILNDKSAAFAFKESQLRLRIARLQSVERQMNIKDEIIEHLREDKLDLTLQLEIIRHRLQSIDPSYKACQQTFSRLVKFVNENNISIMSAFKKFDRDGSASLNKDELNSALNTLGFKTSKSQFQLLFAEFDLDGSQSLTYQQFMRKLKRGGVNTRSKEEQAIYHFFKAIKSANLTIKKAYQVIDMDGSNSITQSQMETAFRKIGIDCDSRSIQSIFKMCDTDMDGTIKCQELEALYNDIIRESEIDDIQLKIQLDWKYKFVLMIEESSIKNKMTLQQTFKELDSDGNSYLSMNELSDLLRKAGVTIQRKYINQLFKFLDVQYDNKVQYGEFLKKLDEAKKQSKRVQRLKAVKDRAEQLRRQNVGVDGEQQVELQKNVASAELNIRIKALESKQQNLVKKSKKLCKNLAEKEQKVKELQKQVEETQDSYQKARSEYHTVLQQNAVWQQKLKNYIGQAESKKIKEEMARLKISNADILPQLDTYKGLSDALHDKNKDDLLSIGQLRAELNKHYEIVKELQSQDIDKAKLGNLAIQLEYSKRNQQIANKKYDQAIEKVGKVEKDNVTLSSDVFEKEKQIVNTHLAMMEKSNLLQKKIDTLTSKIIPTVSISKIDEFVAKLRQISNSKTQVEEQNKALKQKNFNLQLRNDYIENQKIHLEELQKRLRRNYTDDNSVAIIDLTKKLSDYKMGELKAKREHNLLKQKQQYFMRINNANNDNIRELEEELGKWEIKYNERQEFWRKRMADQMKLLEDIQREATKVKESEKKAAEYFNAKAEKDYKNNQYINEMEPGRSNYLRSVVAPAQDNSQTVNSLKEDIQELTRALQDKERQIYQLRTTLQEIVPEQKLKFSTFGSQIGGYAQTNSFVMQTDLTSSQLKNNAKRFINAQKDQQSFYKQQSERMIQAAQQSIDTLQRIIDEKNSQLKRRDNTIDELKKTMMKRQEQDCYEIQKLNEQIRQLRSKKEMANLNQIMNKPTNKNFYPSSNNDQKVKSLMEMIGEKEDQIKKWEHKYNQLYIHKQKVKPSGQNIPQKLIQNKLRELQEERQAQKKKYADAENKLKEKIKNLEKLSKQKDTKLSQLHNAFLEIKEDVLKQKSSVKEQPDQNNDQFIKNMNRGSNPNDSRMEAALQKAMQTIQKLTKKNKDYQNDIRKLRQESRMCRTLHRK